MRKAIYGGMLELLLIGVAISALCTQPVKAQYIIYIRSYGAVEPSIDRNKKFGVGYNFSAQPKVHIERRYQVL